jgi:hypothetical protein
VNIQGGTPASSGQSLPKNRSRNAIDLGDDSEDDSVLNAQIAQGSIESMKVQCGVGGYDSEEEPEAYAPCDFEEDPTLVLPQKQEITTYEGMRMPFVIESLPPLQDPNLPSQPNEEFHHGFLKKVLGGRALSDGWYFIHPNSREGRLFPSLKS